MAFSAPKFQFLLPKSRFLASNRGALPHTTPTSPGPRGIPASRLEFWAQSWHFWSHVDPQPPMQHRWPQIRAFPPQIQAFQPQIQDFDVSNRNAVFSAPNLTFSASGWDFGLKNRHFHKIRVFSLKFSTFGPKSHAFGTKTQLFSREFQGLDLKGSIFDLEAAFSVSNRWFWGQNRCFDL